MPPSSPRRDWQSSMIVPMNSLGLMIVILTTGSYTVRTLPAGQTDGFVTIVSAPSSSTTRYTTFGEVEIRSRSNSRSSRSRLISMCKRPRKPQRKPNPSATDVSGS